MASPLRDPSKYKKLTQREHVILRPDTYVGSVKKRTEYAWVHKDGRMYRHCYIECSGMLFHELGFENRNIEYVPALYKIFDEILVNAADNKSRDPAGMTELRVTIDPERNLIVVYNDGRGK